MVASETIGVTVFDGANEGIDAVGNPYSHLRLWAFLLRVRVGRRMALPLLQAGTPLKRLIADKAYDAQSLRDRLRSRRVIATIPSTAMRTVPYRHSRLAYRRRNRIERLFGHLENWRRVATRYDRPARNPLAAVALVSCAIAWT